jgi:phosphoenolpyruvate-protein kinase (PTS system EI component)
MSSLVKDNSPGGKTMAQTVKKTISEEKKKPTVSEPKAEIKKLKAELASLKKELRQIRKKSAKKSRSQIAREEALDVHNKLLAHLTPQERREYDDRLRKIARKVRNYNNGTRRVTI